MQPVSHRWAPPGRRHRLKTLALTETIFVDIPTSDADIPTSDWRVTVGVPLGLLPGAAVILTGAVIFYKRCRNHRKIQEDENTHKNSAMVQEPSALYENVGRSTPVPAVNKTQGADAMYMDLQHGDQATYGQLERS